MDKNFIDQIIATGSHFVKFWLSQEFAAKDRSAHRKPVTNEIIMQDAVSQYNAVASAWNLTLAWNVGLAAAAAIAVFSALIVVRRIAANRLSREPIAKTPWGPPVARTVQITMSIFLAAAAAYAVLPFFTLPIGLVSAVQFTFVIMASLQGAIWAREIVLALLERHVTTKTDEETVLSNAMGVVGWIVNLAIWSIALLIILSNLGVDITALIAGLGIGGIAVGLAAQGVVADLFAALSILFDRPFVKGDFVVIGALAGEIEEIGLKTTRIRALSGEQIVVSNAQLLSRDIHNFRRMSERRTVFKLGVQYQTDAHSVARIPSVVQGIVTAQEGVRFDRANLTGFGASALEFEVVYYVRSRSYQRAMDVHQAILLEIMARFAAMGVGLSGFGSTTPQARTTP
jgi:small-conductance mechanosensitive channel